MNTSQTIVELVKALQTFQASVSKIKKTETNPFFKSKYADLSTILDAIRKPLEESELSFVQFPCSEEGGNRQGLLTRLMHSSGQYMEETFYMTPVKNDPQAAGSCLTYMRRYALSAILGLNTDEDDDGNEASQPQQAVKTVYSQEKTVYSKQIVACSENEFDMMNKDGGFALSSNISQKTGKPYFLAEWKGKRYFLTEAQHSQLQK